MVCRDAQDHREIADTSRPWKSRRRPYLNLHGKPPSDPVHIPGARAISSVSRRYKKDDDRRGQRFVSSVLVTSGNLSGSDPAFRQNSFGS
jgi:hypothetical protein